MIKTKSIPFKVQNRNNVNVNEYCLFYSIFMGVLESIIKQEKSVNHIKMQIMKLQVSQNKYYEDCKSSQINLKIQ